MPREMVRYDYPVDVVDALDDLGNEPWTDYHIERARQLISDKYPQWRDDFERRVGVLKTIRQQFLAFIVDEYQDTNPAHFLDYFLDYGGQEESMKPQILMALGIQPFVLLAI